MFIRQPDSTFSSSSTSSARRNGASKSLISLVPYYDICTLLSPTGFLTDSLEQGRNDAGSRAASSAQFYAPRTASWSWEASRTGEKLTTTERLNHERAPTERFQAKTQTLHYRIRYTACSRRGGIRYVRELPAVPAYGLRSGQVFTSRWYVRHPVWSGEVLTWRMYRGSRIGCHRLQVNLCEALPI